MKVTFHGVRGSLPSSSPSTRRYGGNTASVRVESGGQALLLDLGSGLQATDPAADDGPFRASALVSHLHLDHIMVLPFFRPWTVRVRNSMSMRRRSVA